MLAAAELRECRGCVAPHLFGVMVREAIDSVRSRLDEEQPTELRAAIVETIKKRIDSLLSTPVSVINATGTLLHTNLGRAPLSEETRAAMTRAAGYTNVEFDLASGARGSRQDHLEPLLKLLIGAEAALVVINNAAAIFLVLRVLAARKDVIISRGEAVEIGDGFRISEIVAQSQARLIEVGSTNITRPSDYQDHVTAKTAAILQVHTSNFSIAGFAGRPHLSELSHLAGTRDLLLLVDNGSGPLVDTSRFGIAHEPMPSEALAVGASVVTFSTDKLLGGPQGGVIAGSRNLIEKIRRHPLARTLRPDKSIVAGLAATLRAYVRGNEMSIPIIHMLAAPVEELQSRAERVVSQLCANGFDARAERAQSTVGGGALPGQMMDSWAVNVNPGESLDAFSGRLRDLPVPIVGRIRHDSVVFDMRTVPEAETVILVRGIMQAASGATNP